MRIDFPTDQTFIAGRWESAADTIPVEDPSTGREIARIARGQQEDIDRAVAAANDARRGAYGRLTAAERGRILLRMSALVAERADQLAWLEATDVGKPLKQARNDVTALARYLEFYGGAADK
ncbi:MAG: aldehyde dehydrogenase family protein, partial [Gemmatimonadales bacterium]